MLPGGQRFGPAFLHQKHPNSLNPSKMVSMHGFDIATKAPIILAALKQRITFIKQII
jgi:hypothetical protein